MSVDEHVLTCGWMFVVQMLRVSETFRRPQSVGQRILNKYRRKHERQVRRREYRKLKAIVPAISRQDNVPKVATPNCSINLLNFVMPVNIDGH